MPSRIVLLDDHRESRRAMVSALSVAGHACFTSRGAEELVASVLLIQPEIVFYEWASRVEARLGLARRIRAVAVSSLVIAVISHEPEPEGFREVEGVDAYFTKPVRIQEIALTLP